jgi:glycine cleavage system H lipoate-binding protein
MKSKCPFLEELLMAYCSACSVKKMIAKDQLISQNPCETDYARCPIFKEFLAKQTKEAKMAEITNNEMNAGEGEKPCIWMKAGVIAYRMCTKNYDCKNCEFDQALLDQSGTYTESPMVVKAIEKLRQLPASERKCRYMLTGDFSYKICSNNYECWHCSVDQYIQDTIDTDPYLQKRRQRLSKKEKKVKGFTIREDYYYLPNHIWIKVEGEVVKVGIDDFAARLIGKMENIELPEKNVISKDDTCWRLGSHNRMVRMTLPTDTEIIEKNDVVLTDPTIIHKEPYGRGWLLKIKSPEGVGSMLKGSQAIDWLEKEFEKLHQEFEARVGITITDGGEIVDNIHERLTNEEWNQLVTQFLS